MGVTTVVKDYGTAILDAIRDSDLKKLRSVLEKQLKADHQIAALCVTDIRHRPTKKFACPFILAARLEDPSIIQYMLDRGTNPNFVHHTVYTSKRREIVTALHVAVDLSHYATVEALLNFNADANIVDHNDETALHIAVKKADRVMTRMLLAKGADPSVVDRRGNAALHVATLFGHLQLVKTLLKYDADVYQRNATGAIPSHIAAREGHIHLIQVYCSRDAGNINVKIPCFSDGREVAPLHLAAENGHVETVIALLDQFKADVNLRDSASNTALHSVVLYPYHPYRMRDRDFFYATAKVLVRYHVAINEKNGQGNTALHLAAAHHHPKIVELLLSVGANPFAENNDRLKPIDIAPEADSVTRQLLKSAMSNPRPAPLDASMLSIRHDLQNLSMPALMPNGFLKTSTLAADTIPNGMVKTSTLAPDAIPLNRLPPPFGVNHSFRSVSSTSSVFVDDTKARLSSLQIAKNAKARHERDNHIPLYKPGPGEKRRSHRDTEMTQSNSLDASVIAATTHQMTRSDQKRRSSRQRTSSDSRVDDSHVVEMKNRANKERDKQHGKDRNRKSSDAPVLPPKRQAAKKDQLIYENVVASPGKKKQSSDRLNVSQAEGRKHKKESRHKAKISRQSDDEEDEEDDDDDENTEFASGYYEDDAGVRVHTVPGKPSTIEVEYSGGPITISVDTQGNSFEDTLQYEEDESVDLSSEQESPQVSFAKTKKKHKTSETSEKQKVSKKHQVENVDERTDSKRHKKKSKHSEPIYWNQEQIEAEKRRKEEQLARAEEQKLLEQERAAREAEKQQQEDEEAKRLRREERERRRAKKQQRRLQRQDIQEPEAPVVLESKPTLSYPAEMWQEPEYDSDHLENEQFATMEMAKQKATAAAQSVIVRWSEAEDEWPEQEERVKMRPKKPPRPGYIATHEPSVETEDWSMEPAGTSHLDFDSDASPVEEDVPSSRPSSNPIPMPRTSIGYGKKYETVVRELQQSVTVEVATVCLTKSIGKASTTSGFDKWIDASVKEHAEQDIEETLPDDDLSTSCDVTVDVDDVSINEPTSRQRGLKMRVTGEVPKAYTRAQKSSARKAFMLAAPVGIESSSEASDSECHSSRLSLSDSLLDRSAQRRAEWNSDWEKSRQPPDITTFGSKDDVTPKPIAYSRYAKPYSSFGKIEPQVDALEEALMEEELKPFSSPESGADNETVVKSASVESLVLPSVSHLEASDIVSPNAATDHQQQVKEKKKFNKSAELSSDELEEYDEEPGLRRPGLHTLDDSDLEEYNNEPGDRKQKLQQDFDQEPGRRKPLAEHEYENTRMEQEFDQEPGARKAKVEQENDQETVGRKLKVEHHYENIRMEEDFDHEPGGRKQRMELEYDQEPGPRKQRTQGKEKPKRSKHAINEVKIHSPIIVADIWEEAMSGQPLASSEAYDLPAPQSKNGIKDSTVAFPNLHGSMESADYDETVDDKSYDSFVPLQPVMSVVTRWDEQSLETNLDDYLAGIEANTKTLDMHAPSSSKKRITGRRKEKGKTKTLETNIDDVLPEPEPPVEQPAKKPKPKTKKQTQKKGDRIVNILGAEEGSRDEIIVDDDAYRYKQTGNISVNIPLWQDQNVDDEEEHYANIDDSLPDIRNQRWEEDSTAGSEIGIQEELQPFSSVTGPLDSCKAEIVDVLPDPRRPPGGRMQNFKPTVQRDTGLSRPRQRTIPQRHDAYMSETELSNRHQQMYSDQSDTESVGGKAPVPRSIHAGIRRQVHSEAEASDYELPPGPTYGKSIRQSAMDAINRGATRRRPPTFVLIQPGHHDKNFNHIRRMFRAPKKRRKGLTCVASAGRYRDSLLSTSRNSSMTESDTDNDDRLGNTETIDHSQFDAIARLWVEQMNAKMVQKSGTMFLSILPPGKELPQELTSSYRSQSTPDLANPPQWVIARGRTLQSRQGRLSNENKDLDTSRPGSPGAHHIIFFKLSANWMDLAWILFEGLQSQPETVRMIRDIELKNPSGISDQVHDLMHRWWRRRGLSATMAELQRALDTCSIAYIQEEFQDQRASIVSYSDTEDDLDVGQISDADPDVSRLIQEYDGMSLGVSFMRDNPPSLPVNPPPPSATRQLEMRHSKLVNQLNQQKSRSFLAEGSSLDSSFGTSGSPQKAQEKHVTNL